MERKKKNLSYKGKPLLRCGDRVFYGFLDDQYILVLDVMESEPINGIKISKKVKIALMDNTGELGNGQIFRRGERSSLYEALDIGEWWLKQALQSQAN